MTAATEHQCRSCGAPTSTTGAVRARRLEDYLGDGRPMYVANCQSCGAELVRCMGRAEKYLQYSPAEPLAFLESTGPRSK